MHAYKNDTQIYYCSLSDFEELKFHLRASFCDVCAEDRKDFQEPADTFVALLSHGLTWLPLWAFPSVGTFEICRLGRLFDDVCWFRSRSMQGSCSRCYLQQKWVYNEFSPVKKMIWSSEHRTLKSRYSEDSIFILINISLYICSRFLFRWP